MPARRELDYALLDLEGTVDSALYWLSGAPRPTGSSAAFELFDVDGRSRWRLVTPAGRIVATSADAYASSASAEAATERLKSLSRSRRTSPRVVPDAGTYRWSFVADNGRVLAASVEAFASRHAAERAARDARELVAIASPPSRGAAESSETTRHVVAEADGGWVVQQEGSSRSSSVHSSQAEALDAARQQARNATGGAEIVVHRRDGRIVD